MADTVGDADADDDAVSDADPDALVDVLPESVARDERELALLAEGDAVDDADSVGEALLEGVFDDDEERVDDAEPLVLRVGDDDWEGLGVARAEAELVPLAEDVFEEEVLDDHVRVASGDSDDDEEPVAFLEAALDADGVAESVLVSELRGLVDDAADAVAGAEGEAETVSDIDAADDWLGELLPVGERVCDSDAVLEAEEVADLEGGLLALAEGLEVMLVVSERTTVFVREVVAL